MKQQELSGIIYRTKMQLAEQWQPMCEPMPFNEAVSFLENQRRHYVRESVRLAIKYAVPEPVKERPGMYVYRSITKDVLKIWSEPLIIDHVAKDFSREIIDQGFFAKDFVCEKIVNPYGYDLILRFNI